MRDRERSQRGSGSAGRPTPRFFGAPSDEPNLDQGVSYIENFGLTLGDRLLTDEARRLAEPRLAYMRGFLEQLRSELPPGTQP